MCNGSVVCLVCITEGVKDNQKEAVTVGTDEEDEEVNVCIRVSTSPGGTQTQSVVVPGSMQTKFL